MAVATGRPIPERLARPRSPWKPRSSMGLRGFDGGVDPSRVPGKYWRRSHPGEPDFTVDQIVAWADAWYERNAQRPITSSGNIPGTDGITWKIVDAELREGRADCPGGISLSRLLTAILGNFHLRDQPRLTEDQILAWPTFTTSGPARGRTAIRAGSRQPRERLESG